VKQITIHRVSCNACGEIFCGTTQKKALCKHKIHIKKCKVLRFWEEANKILGRELSLIEVNELLGIKHKALREQE